MAGGEAGKRAPHDREVARGGRGAAAAAHAVHGRPLQSDRAPVRPRGWRRRSVHARAISGEFAALMPAAKPRAAGRASKTAAASPAGGGGRAAATRSPAPARGAQDEASDLIDALLSKKALGGSPRANGRAEAHEGAAELAALENSPLPVKVADAGATKLTPLKRKTAGADSPGGKSQLPPDAAAKK